MRNVETKPWPCDRPDPNPRGWLMTPDGALFSPDSLRETDDIRPVFVNGDYNHPGDLGDWWLDLGHIDLPA
jgi:hypothetical protein